jgi:hypothetical protein
MQSGDTAARGARRVRPARFWYWVAGAAVVAAVLWFAFPASAQAEAAELGDLADRIAMELQEQAGAGSPEEYQRLAADNQELGNAFDQQEQTLVSSLSA